MTKTHDQIINEIRALFIERVDAQLPPLQGFLKKLKNEKIDSNDIKEIVFITHQLAGSGKAFGFDDVSTLAKQVETLLGERELSPEETIPPLEALCNELQEI